MLLPDRAAPAVRRPCLRSVAVVDDVEAHDLAVADAEVVGQDQRVGEAGLVVVAVVAGADVRVAVVVDDLGDVERDVVADDLLRDPGTDGVGAPELAVVVVDECVVGERRDDRVGVEGVDGGDVIGDERR